MECRLVPFSCCCCAWRHRVVVSLGYLICPNKRRRFCLKIFALMVPPAFPIAPCADSHNSIQWFAVQISALTFVDVLCHCAVAFSTAGFVLSVAVCSLILCVVLSPVNQDQQPAS